MSLVLSTSSVGESGSAVYVWYGSVGVVNMSDECVSVRGAEALLIDNFVKVPSTYPILGSLSARGSGDSGVAVVWWSGC